MGKTKRQLKKMGGTGLVITAGGCMLFGGLIAIKKAFTPEDQGGWGVPGLSEIIPEAIYDEYEDYLPDILSGGKLGGAGKLDLSNDNNKTLPNTTNYIPNRTNTDNADIPHFGDAGHVPIAPERSITGQDIILGTAGILTGGALAFTKTGRAITRAAVKAPVNIVRGTVNATRAGLNTLTGKAAPPPVANLQRTASPETGFIRVEDILPKSDYYVVKDIHNTGRFNLEGAEFKGYEIANNKATASVWETAAGRVRSQGLVTELPKGIEVARTSEIGAVVPKTGVANFIARGLGTLGLVPIISMFTASLAAESSKANLTPAERTALNYSNLAGLSVTGNPVRSLPPGTLMTDSGRIVSMPSQNPSTASRNTTTVPAAAKANHSVVDFPNYTPAPAPQTGKNVISYNEFSWANVQPKGGYSGGEYGAPAGVGAGSGGGGSSSGGGGAPAGGGAPSGGGGGVGGGGFSGISGFTGVQW